MRLQGVEWKRDSVLQNKGGGMLLEQVQKYFETEEGLAELLKVLQDRFSRIDDRQEQLEHHIMNTIIEYCEAKEELAGIKMYLNPIYSEAITWKSNKEKSKYMELKIAIENKPVTTDEKGKTVKEKFSSAPTEVEASEFVASWRRIRNILEGYINSCYDGIRQCEQRIVEIKGENSLIK